MADQHPTNPTPTPNPTPSQPSPQPGGGSGGTQHPQAPGQQRPDDPKR